MLKHCRTSYNVNICTPVGLSVCSVYTPKKQQEFKYKFKYFKINANTYTHTHYINHSSIQSLHNTRIDSTRCNKSGCKYIL